MSAGAGRLALGSLQRFFMPEDPASSAIAEDAPAIRRSARVVGVVGGASLLTFMPSLVIAGVPAGQWAVFMVAAFVAVCVISGSLLIVHGDSKIALVAAAVDALVIVGLHRVIGDYFHVLVLLYTLVLVGHAVIHGARPAAVMAGIGGLLIPIELMGTARTNPTDFIFAFMYLHGLILVIWIRQRLVARQSLAVTESEARYRTLVETVPAVVYVAGYGPEGRWRYVGRQVEALLGFPAEDWTADPGFWWSRVHPDDHALVLNAEDANWQMTSGQRVAAEYRMLARDGRVRWIRDEATVVRSSDGAGEWSGFLTDVTDRKALEDELKAAAFHDALTGLANRALFFDRVTHALARTHRDRLSLAVLFLDLDDFKTVNDGLGHTAGDALLAQVASRLVRCLRSGDTPARLGGDEFGILLEDLQGSETAETIAGRLLEGLTQPFVIDGKELSVSASIGIARPTSHRERTEELLRSADVAMYAAKGLGKGRVETYQPQMHEAVVRRLQLVAEIRQALEVGELRVHYQPIVDVRGGSIYGYEALARWAHPQRGLLSPDSFISAAEETGQIIALGHHVLGEACRHARLWQDASPLGRAPAVSVNVSARQFRDEHLPEVVADAIAEAGLEPGSLILEITESVVMEDSEDSMRRLHELKTLGVRLAIDDFGTGYSSLGYLRRLPVDIIKIDKSFVDGIATGTPDGQQAFELARIIVRMARTLHLRVIAEGVETAAQASALRRMGCELAQGYHYARPMDEAGLAVYQASREEALARVS